VSTDALPDIKNLKSMPRSKSDWIIKHSATFNNKTNIKNSNLGRKTEKKYTAENLQKTAQGKNQPKKKQKKALEGWMPIIRHVTESEESGFDRSQRPNALPALFEPKNF
jgi:hypothetical protein